MKLKDIIKESVNFAADQINLDDNFSDILSMCNYAARKFYEKMTKEKPFLLKYITDQKSKQYAHIDFEPDDNDYDKPTGIINVYIHNIITDQFAPDFKELLNFTVEELNKKVVTGPLQYEGGKTESGDSREPVNKNDSFSKVSVVRIPIIKNEIKKSEFKEMNLANANARMLLSVLGLDSEELVGRIENKDIPRMIMKIRNLSDDKINANTRDANISQGQARVEGDRISKGATMHDFGLSADKMKHYLMRFSELLQQAYDNKLDVTYA